MAEELSDLLKSEELNKVGLVFTGVSQDNPQDFSELGLGKRFSVPKAIPLPSRLSPDCYAERTLKGGSYQFDLNPHFEPHSERRQLWWEAGGTNVTARDVTHIITFSPDLERRLTSLFVRGGVLPAYELTRERQPPSASDYADYNQTTKEVCPGLYIEVRLPHTARPRFGEIVVVKSDLPTDNPDVPKSGWKPNVLNVNNERVYVFPKGPDFVRDNAPKLMREIDIEKMMSPLTSTYGLLERVPGSFIVCTFGPKGELPSSLAIRVWPMVTKAEETYHHSSNSLKSAFR